MQVSQRYNTTCLSHSLASPFLEGSLPPCLISPSQLLPPQPAACPALSLPKMCFPTAPPAWPLILLSVCIVASVCTCSVAPPPHTPRAQPPSLLPISRFSGRCRLPQNEKGQWKWVPQAHLPCPGFYGMLPSPTSSSFPQASFPLLLGLVPRVSLLFL